MKKIFILATVIVSGLAFSLQAEEGDKGKGKGKGDPAARADAMIKKLDTDGNSTLSKTEFAAGPQAEKMKAKEGMLDKFFAARDTNSDGELDKAELSKPVQGGKGKGPKGGEGKGKGPKDGEGKGKKGEKDAE